MQDKSKELAAFRKRCLKAAKQFEESTKPACQEEYKDGMTDKQKGFIEGAEWVRRSFNLVTAGRPLEYFFR